MTASMYQRRSRVREYLSEEEFQLLLDQTRTEEGYLLLRCLWETGGRVSEVTHLRPESIDVRNNCLLLINLKQHKRRHPQDPKLPPPLKRVYLFPTSDLAQRLADYSRKVTGWVFPSRRSIEKPMSPVWVWRFVTRLATKSGVRHIKKDPRTGEYANRPAWPHLFRHGAGMYLLKRTGRLDVVRDQLGHSSVQSTEGYAGLTDAERQRILQETAT